MRVLVLTSDASRHLTFAARVLGSFENVTVGIEPKTNSPIRRRTVVRTIRSGAPRVRARILNKLYSSLYPNVVGRYWTDKREIESDYFEEFADDGINDITANTLFRVSEADRINDAVYVKRIQDYRPDVILVMGTSLLSRRIIDSSVIASLNIHTGLSPYYRGSNTNFWPLVQDRPEYCGVTVHGLTQGIDPSCKGCSVNTEPL